MEDDLQMKLFALNQKFICKIFKKFNTHVISCHGRIRLERRYGREKEDKKQQIDGLTTE
jgi:hypothetical protein